MRVIIESPLKGKYPAEFQNNLRYLLWCCRAVYLHGERPIASHLICPWFMDDGNDKERSDGIDWPWMWDKDVPHWFFDDFGFSKGMSASHKRCADSGIPYEVYYLAHVDPECKAAFDRGEWPPHTEGFQLNCEPPEKEVVSENV